MNEIQYRPGNTNYVADELFRNPPDPLTDKSLRTTVKTTQEMKTLMVNRIRDGPPIEEVIADYQLLKLYEDAPKELLATVRPRSTPTPRKGKKRKAADEKESTSQDDGLRGMIQLVIDQQQQILKNQETMIDQTLPGMLKQAWSGRNESPRTSRGEKKRSPSIPLNRPTRSTHSDPAR